MLLSIVTLVLALQDPKPLPAIIDSWYEVTEDGAYSGWYHETVSKSDTGHGYFSEGEFNRSDATVVEKCVGALDAGFAFTASEGGSILPPAMYLLRQRGDLAKAGEVKLNGVTYQIKTMVDRKVLDKIVKVTPVVNEKGTPLSKFWVDKYGRIIEAESADGKFVLKLAKDSVAAKGGMLELRGRRDPFGKQLTPKGSVPEKIEEITAKRPLPIVPDDFMTALKDAEALLDRLGQELAACGLGAEKTYQDLLVYFEKLHAGARQAGRMPQVLRLKQTAERWYGGEEKLLREAMAALERTADSARAHDMEAIDKEIARIRKWQGSREFFQGQAENIAMMKAIMGRAMEFRDQCEVRMQLARMSIQVEGVVIQHEEIRESVDLNVNIFSTSFQVEQPVMVARVTSTASINGESYNVGDVIAGLGARVNRITRQSVEVWYRGEIREIGLRK